MSAKPTIVFRADFAAPLIGIAPYPKVPTAISYGKWVALMFDGVWYIELGCMDELHWALEISLRKRIPGIVGEDCLNGIIEQRGGPGTHPTIRLRGAQVPSEIEDAIRTHLLTAQGRLKGKKP